MFSDSKQKQSVKFVDAVTRDAYGVYFSAQFKRDLMTYCNLLRRFLKASEPSSKWVELDDAQLASWMADAAKCSKVINVFDLKAYSVFRDGQCKCNDAHSIDFCFSYCCT